MGAAKRCRARNGEIMYARYADTSKRGANGFGACVLKSSAPLIHIASALLIDDLLLVYPRPQQVLHRPFGAFDRQSVYVSLPAIQLSAWGCHQRLHLPRFQPLSDVQRTKLKPLRYASHTEPRCPQMCKPDITWGDRTHSLQGLRSRELSEENVRVRSSKANGFSRIRLTFKPSKNLSH